MDKRADWGQEPSDFFQVAFAMLAVIVAAWAVGDASYRLYHFYAGHLIGHTWLADELKADGALLLLVALLCFLSYDAGDARRRIELERRSNNERDRFVRENRDEKTH